MRQRLLKDVSGSNSVINDSAVISGARAHLSLLKDIHVCEEIDGHPGVSEKILIWPGDKYDAPVGAE